MNTARPSVECTGCTGTPFCSGTSQSLAAGEPWHTKDCACRFATCPGLIRFGENDFDSRPCIMVLVTSDVPTVSCLFPSCVHSG